MTNSATRMKVALKWKNWSLKSCHVCRVGSKLPDRRGPGDRMLVPHYRVGSEIQTLFSFFGGVAIERRPAFCFHGHIEVKRKVDCKKSQRRGTVLEGTEEESIK